jgi:hypothetical protein
MLGHNNHNDLENITQFVKQMDTQVIRDLIDDLNKE